MAQNIQLSDRVRYFPTKTKADILPRLGAKFITTLIFDGETASIQVPKTFEDWQTNASSYASYQTIVGSRDNSGAGGGLVSDLDWNIFVNCGLLQTPLNVMNKHYNFYYGENVNPETGLNSGFVLYDVYNFQPYSKLVDGSISKNLFYVSVDIYESTELINTATAYSQINQ